MTLRRFLDAAFVLLIEEFRSTGISYHDAVDRLREIGGASPSEPSQPPPENTAAMNDMAMKALMGALPGGRMPG